MALALVELPQQIPLPDPDALPAWVHAALDKWDTRNATYIGLSVLKHSYPELNDVSENTRRIESKAFRRLRYLATRWQFANFRTHITTFEMRLLELELEALQKPYAMKAYRYKYLAVDRAGNSFWVTEDAYQHDVDWIAGYIQRQMGFERVAIDIQQIKHMLIAISSVLEVCAEMDIPVEYVDSHYKKLPNIQPQVLPKRRKLQRTLQKAS